MISQAVECMQIVQKFQAAASSTSCSTTLVFSQKKIENFQTFGGWGIKLHQRYYAAVRQTGNTVGCYTVTSHYNAL